MFQQTFEVLPGEKLLNAYACYISTSTGPVIGTLYVSSKMVAFCSEYPFCYYSSTGQQQWMYYKVLPSTSFLSGVSFLQSKLLNFENNMRFSMSYHLSSIKQNSHVAI